MFEAVEPSTISKWICHGHPWCAPSSASMVGMELLKTADGDVTHLALVCALRGLSNKAVAKLVCANAQDVLDWELGRSSIPRSKAKRVGLALRWPWEALLLEPLEYDDAYHSLVEARRHSVEPRAQMG